LTPSASADLELMRASLLLESDRWMPRGGRLTSWRAHRTRRSEPAARHRPPRARDPAGAAALLESSIRAHSDSAFMQLELGSPYRCRWPQLAAAAGACGARWRSMQDWQTPGASSGEAVRVARTLEAISPTRATVTYGALRDRRCEYRLAENRLQALPKAILRDVCSTHRTTRWHCGCSRTLPAAEDQAERNAAMKVSRRPRLRRGPVDLAPCCLHSKDCRVLRFWAAAASEPHNVDWLSLKAAALRLVGRTTRRFALIGTGRRSPCGQRSGMVIFGHVLREVGSRHERSRCSGGAVAVRTRCGRPIRASPISRPSVSPTAAVGDARQLARSALHTEDVHISSSRWARRSGITPVRSVLRALWRAATHSTGQRFL